MARIAIKTSRIFQIVSFIQFGLLLKSVTAIPSIADSCRVEVLSRDGCDFDIDETRVFEDIEASLADDGISVDDLSVPRSLLHLEEAMKDFSSDDKEKGETAWKFLKGLANSKTFVSKYWHKRPLVIREAQSGAWAKGSFTVERDLRLVDNSFITGHKTAEIIRNGTKTDTWELSPLKDNPMRKTVWKDVQSALDGGTVYFNTAGSLWPNLGGLCRMTSFAFGLPPNVNVYITPPGCTLSVPPHTDRQDVLVFQTQGAKRWRVYKPPARSRGKDPLNRGKNGDVLSFEEMGPPIIDTVLQSGDVLYVPTGFPHTTDTSTAVDGVDETIFQEPSVHLTMGLDTHVWCLTMAHARWSLLQRCGKNFNLNIEDDVAYWNAMETMPLGFLAGDAWKDTIRSISSGNGLGDEYKKYMIDGIKKVLIELEPNRWKESTDLEQSAESLPSDDEIGEVIDYMVESHWRSLMETQENLFLDVDPKSDETLVKAFHGTQEQNLLMEKFGEFSKNEAFAKSFAQRRLDAEQRTKGLL